MEQPGGLVANTLLVFSKGASCHFERSEKSRFCSVEIPLRYAHRNDNKLLNGLLDFCQYIYIFSDDFAMAGKHIQTS